MFPLKGKFANCLSDQPELCSV